MKRSEIKRPYAKLMKLPLETIIEMAWWAMWYGFDEHQEFAAKKLGQLVEETLRPFADAKVASDLEAMARG